jgi:hypothetical protein
VEGQLGPKDHGVRVSPPFQTFLWKKDMLVDVAVKNLEGLVVYFEKYKNGIDLAIIEAKEIAENIGVKPEFSVKRYARRKKHFDEIPNSEREQQSAKESFRTDYF